MSIVKSTITPSVRPSVYLSETFLSELRYRINHEFLMPLLNFHRSTSSCRTHRYVRFGLTAVFPSLARARIDRAAVKLRYVYTHTCTQCKTRRVQKKGRIASPGRKEGGGREDRTRQSKGRMLRRRAQPRQESERRTSN